MPRNCFPSYKCTLPTLHTAHPPQQAHYPRYSRNAVSSLRPHACLHPFQALVTSFRAGALPASLMPVRVGALLVTNPKWGLHTNCPTSGSREHQSLRGVVRGLTANLQEVAIAGQMFGGTDVETAGQLAGNTRILSNGLKRNQSSRLTAGGRSGIGFPE